MSQAQVEKKVEDYLRNSQALQDYWQRPITARQLQAEIDRMAQNTKQGEVLQELFDALGNDPFVIAECLARPSLAKRLITNWYAYDQRIHGKLRQRVEAELQMHNAVGQMKQFSGKYSEIELVRSDRTQARARYNTGHSIELSNHDWDEIIQTLAATFNKPANSLLSSGDGAPSRAFITAHSAVAAHQTLPPGKLSSLQEDESRYYVTAVINQTNNHLKLAVVSWLKEPLAPWLAGRQSQAPAIKAAPVSDYSLPKIVEGGCIDDTWTGTAGPPDTRAGYTAVWTGTEMLVWGGQAGNGSNFFFNTGAKYNPSTDSWTATSTVNAPNARSSHIAVWTGSEMVVWGGIDQDFIDLKSGGRYSPSTDSWIATSTANSPDGRDAHSAVWTGNEMIIWGGWDGSTFFNTGGKYNPNTDGWIATSITNAPASRSLHTAVWTGSEMIIWGGGSCVLGCPLNTGGRYDPSTDSWTETNTAGAPDARIWHTAVWTDMEMIVWGGTGGGFDLFNTGGRYNPNTDSWTETNTAGAPDPRELHTAIWTGSQMLVWGGFTGSNSLNTGGTYNPATDSWTQTNTTNAPSPRDSHTSVWTGSEMIVWGGFDKSTFPPLNTGGRYDPNTDSWIGVSANTPDARYLHTAVWTGTEMVVWGGTGSPFVFTLFNTGGKYNLSTDSWTDTNTAGAPDGRFIHTAVWTGSEMIIWGGEDPNGPGRFNTGGKYNPITDSWTATGTANAPDARFGHTAVWTGSQMIVWGGSGNVGPLGTGGRYDPGANSWAPTSTSNVPIARGDHTAVWAGNQMIVWGGGSSAGYLNSGGRYNPSTDSWTAMPTANAPTARSAHTAVWTGNKMIVWGGEDRFANDFNTGGRYDPGTDIWTPTSTTNVPDARTNHTAVWSGSEMIVWGGNNSELLQDLNTGGRYNPNTDSWTATSAATLAPREHHTAVWTGSEMIIWGGTNSPNFYDFNTGGRYCAPTPTPTPCTGRCEPTPRPRPTPHPRPIPPR
jgi:N-acetylneuraminic acid mutarotase